DGVDLGNIITKGLAQLSEELQEQVLQPFREAIRKVEGIPEGLSQRLGYLTILKTLSRALSHHLSVSARNRCRPAPPVVARHHGDGGG
ncbi:MAG: hypothetical protein ACE5FD_10710, partial [Anaerolineae bacterium]